VERVGCEDFAPLDGVPPTTQPASRVTAHGLRFPGRHALKRSVVQQRSTATTALSSTFGFIQMRPGQRKQGYKQLLRGVRDEEVAFKSCHPD